MGHPAPAHKVHHVQERSTGSRFYLFKYLPTYFKFECHSPLHNKNSSSVISSALNWTTFIAAGRSNIEEHYQKITVIPQGVIVSILGTRCDGIPDCWNKVDEDNCGYSQLKTFLMGNLFTVHAR